MLTPGELARFLTASAARTERELTARTEKFVAGVAKDARALIGQELDLWPPLKERTVREKQSAGYTGRVSSTDPLLRSGKLRAMIESDAQREGGGVVGVVGTEDEKAVFHEFGTSRMPPRPFLATAMRQAEPRIEVVFGRLGVELLSPGIR